MREAAGMPPYGQLAALIVAGRDEEQVQDFCRMLAGCVPQAADVLVLGPAVAPIARVRGRFRYRFLVKTPRSVDMQAFLRAWLKGVRVPGGIRLDVDVDPYGFL